MEVPGLRLPPTLRTFSSHQATNSIWSSDRPDVVVSAVTSVLGLGTGLPMKMLMAEQPWSLFGTSRKLKWC